MEYLNKAKAFELVVFGGNCIPRPDQLKNHRWWFSFRSSSYPVKYMFVPVSESCCGHFMSHQDFSCVYCNDVISRTRNWGEYEIENKVILMYNTYDLSNQEKDDILCIQFGVFEYNTMSGKVTKKADVNGPVSQQKMDRIVRRTRNKMTMSCCLLS